MRDQARSAPGLQGRTRVFSRPIKGSADPSNPKSVAHKRGPLSGCALPSTRPASTSLASSAVGNHHMARPATCASAQTTPSRNRTRRTHVLPESNAQSRPALPLQAPCDTQRTAPLNGRRSPERRLASIRLTRVLHAVVPSAESTRCTHCADRRSSAHSKRDRARARLSSPRLRKRMAPHRCTRRGRAHVLGLQASLKRSTC